MGALEAIGRTNTLRAVTGDITNLAQQMRQNAIQERQMGLNEQVVKSELADAEFARKKQQEQYQLENKPIPMSMITEAFPIPEVAQYATKYATALGAVEDINGVPSIRAGKAKEIYQLLHQGDHPEVISSLTVNHYRNKVGEIKNQLAELQQSGKDLSKDKNAIALAQGLKQAQQGLVTSLEQADKLQTYTGLAKQGYSPENIQKAMETGDMSLLGEPASDISGVTDIERFVQRANQESIRTTGKPLTPQEQNDASLRFKRVQSEEAGAVQGAKERAKVETAGQLKEAEQTGKGIAEVNMGQYEAATNAVNQVKDIDQLINQIDSSKAITGLGADILKNVQRVKVLLGGDPSKVTDTELLDVMMGKEVFPMIKSLGVGARGLDTPAEREFMRQVLTGSLSLNKKTLKRMAEIRRNIATRAINKWNDRTESGELDNFYKNTGIQKKKIDIGGRVRVMSPDGQPGTIPSDQLEEALSNGYRRF